MTDTSAIAEAVDGFVAALADGCGVTGPIVVTLSHDDGIKLAAAIGRDPALVRDPQLRGAAPSRALTWVEVFGVRFEWPAERR